jgi:hypothetical protein
MNSKRVELDNLCLPTYILAVREIINTINVILLQIISRTIVYII